MNLLRSVTRRGFTVGTAGWFTITSPRRWFSASQLPTGFQDFLDRPKRTAARIIPFPPPSKRDQMALDRTNRTEATIPLQLISPSASNLHLIRLILIVLAAAALTVAALWLLDPAHFWLK